MLSKLSSKLKSKVRSRKNDDKVTVSSPDDGNAVGTNVDGDARSTQGTDTDPSQRANLWVVAGEKLNEKHRIALDLKDAGPVTDSIEDVIKTTEEKYREYKEGGLKIRKRGGGEINVRDSAKNIILYALQAQDLIKKLVSFDPSGHASTAWSVVSIGLTLIVNDIERRDDIFEASEYLARILSYYAIIDNNYRKRGVESDRGLEDALVEVYTAVLEYAAEVKRGVHESDAARVLKSITALVEQPLKDLKETIEAKEKIVQNWKSLTADLDHRKLAEGMLDSIDEAVERLKEIQSRTRSLQEREILDWLSKISYSDIHNNTHIRRASDTGDWFLNSPTYTKWKATPGKILWGYGAVGCGKSVLCSTVIQDIETHCESDPSKKFAYWYFQFSNDETQKVYNMVRSILRQLMPRTLPGSLVNLWKDHSHRGSEPQLQKFVNILDTVLEDSEGESFLVLDAMDECPTTEHDGRSSLLEFIEDLSRKHPSKLHILATSRPEPDIRSRLEHYESFDLESGLGGDVETFVHDQISHGRLSEWDEPVKKRTLERLLDIQERRFRWADLQIKRLQESKSRDAFLKALDTIPATLEETYRHILERLSPDDRKAAHTILIWLSFSFVPLNLKTVAAVVSFRFPDDVVKTCTTSLVTVSISDDTVRLAHFSVKEFLVCDETPPLWYQFSVSSGHLAMAHKTIDSLLEVTEVLTKKTAEQRPLLIYSAKHWKDHLAELGEKYANDADLDDKVFCLFKEPNIYLNWMHLVGFEVDWTWHQSLEELESPLSSASGKGLEATVKRLLSEHTDPGLMIKGKNWRYHALFRAAGSGHLDILEFLLKTADEIPRQVVRHMLSCFQVTEANKKKVPIILDLLWDKGYLQDPSRTSQKIIDAELVEAAAWSFGPFGYLLISHLLDQKKKYSVRLTEKLFDIIKSKVLGDQAPMGLLLDNFDIDIKLTPSRAESLAISLTTTENLTTAVAILNRWLNNIELSETILGGLSSGMPELMEFLLQKHVKQVRITQRVLIEAIEKATDPQMISLLLERRDPGTAINRDILLANAKRTSNGREFMEILLDACGSDTVIDTEIIQEIAKNSDEGLGMMKLLIRRQQTGFIVTKQTFCNAAMHNSLEMLELLVSNSRGSDFPITEDILIAVARNQLHGEALIKYLFDLKGHDLAFSESLLVSIAKIKYSAAADSVLVFLLERWVQIPVTDELLEAACLHSNTLTLLLDRRHDYLATQEVVQKVAADRGNGGQLLEILLNRQLVEVDEWLIETVAGNYCSLETIYKRDPHFLVTPKVVIAAARDVDAMRLLLDRQQDQILITEDVIQAALLGLHPDDVTDLLLTRLGPEKLPITEDILIFAVQKNRVRCLELFLERDHDHDLNTVWQAIWQNPEVDRVTLARASMTLLQYHDFDVSEKMLEKLPAEKNAKFYWVSYPFDTFVRACMLHRTLLPTTEAAMELIVRGSSLDTIEIFLENYPSIVITDLHIEAAKSNSREDMDKDALMSLLSSRLVSRTHHEGMSEMESPGTIDLEMEGDNILPLGHCQKELT